MHCVRVCVAYMCNILVREQSHSQGWWVELDDKPRREFSETRVRSPTA